MQGFPVLGKRRKRTATIIQSCAAVVDGDTELDPLCRPEGGGSHPLGRLIKAPRRQMRPAKNGGSTRRMTSAGRNDAGKKSASRPMPAPTKALNEQAGRKTKSSGSGGIRPTAVVEPPLPKAGGGGGGGGVNQREGRNEDIRHTASFGRGGGVLSGDRTAQTT